MTALSTLRALPGVRRAWPKVDGTLIFERLDEAARLRAGRVDADGAVWLAEYAQDPKLPDLAAAPGSGRLVVHRLGRRAVLLGRDRAIKLVRDGHGLPIASASRRVGRLCARAGIGAAEVLDATESRVDFARLPGQTLHELGLAGAAGWYALAEAWPRLAAAEADLSSHGPEQEAAVLERWLGLAQRFAALPRLAELGEAVRRVQAELCAAADPLVVAHRDLHDKQLLFDGARLALLDLDTAARAEAALDLGNLWAHVELRAAQGHLCEEFGDELFGVLDAMAAALPISPGRLRLYRQSARLRLCFVYAFRPRATPWLPGWVESTLRRGAARTNC